MDVHAEEMKQIRKQAMWKGIWIGVGIGCAVGGGVAYGVTRKNERRRAEDAIKRAKRNAYIAGKEKGFEAGLEENVSRAVNDPNGSEMVQRIYQKGVDDATEEARKWIEENSVTIDPNDPEASQKAIAEARERINATNVDDGTVFSGGNIEQVGNADGMPFPYGEETLSEGGVEQLKFTTIDGSVHIYPKRLFYASDGRPLEPMTVRGNLKGYEMDTHALGLMWATLGFGTYIAPGTGKIEYDGYPSSEETEHVPSREEIDNWDLNIDDETLGDGPKEETERRERYLKDLEKNRNGRGGIEMISEKEFDEECYLEKINVDYYPGDNVFIESTDIDKPIDAVNLFGVADGNWLFENRKHFDEDEDDNDPDIVRIKNFKMNTVAEITRNKGSYASVKDGSAYLNGSTAEG